ncbi:MAG: AbrB family transcriptional regulator [Chelatococcus sp.]|uniref:AbrB family transcriptional regulator n=1 Tax=Chelatococcus sp. TaxID=1953771 RepID=UPI0025C6AD60|nr:AbrB family transcriptional regulator [Chelatococcus sp.]MBX3536875.1 AbrB family transcriptional regulator [Chelatococcus sp.]
MTRTGSVLLASARQVAQIAVAGAGGVLFLFLGVPAAWVAGPVTAVAVLCFMRRSVPMARPLVEIGFLLAGFTMGATATPEALSALTRYPVSLLLLALSVLGVLLLTSLWLKRTSGWTLADAVLGSAPGALSTVMAVAADRGGNVGLIAVVQSFRLFVLVLILPMIIVLSGGATEVPQTGEVLAPLPFAVIMALSFVLSLVLQRLRIAAPMLLGALVVSLLAHGLGLVQGRLPVSLYTVSLVLVGAFVGSRFATVNRQALIAAFPAAVGSFAVSFAIALGFALVSWQLADVTFAAAIIAFAPGGLEVMTVLALLLGLDPIFVGAHHLARFILVALLLPIIIAAIHRVESRRLKNAYAAGDEPQ